MDNLKTALILVVLIVSTKMIGGIPWWSFVAPVLVAGIVLTVKKWEVAFFTTGFLTGFILWPAVTLYFHFSFAGDLLHKIGPGLSVAMLLASGLLGGVLTGLALYTGKAMVADRTAEFTL